MICENSPPPSVCTPASKKYVVSGLINQFWPIAPELSPAGRSTYDWFGNAAFAAASDEYGDVITALRPAPHATNGGTGSPPTTGTDAAGAAGAIVVDDASFPASIDNTSAVIDITSPRTTYFELRTPTGISRRVTSGCRHRRAGPKAGRSGRSAAGER